MSTSAEASGDRSIAAGGGIRQVATGDHVTQAERVTVLPPEAFAPVECPPGLVNLPGRSELFVGRERELALLDGAFTGERGVVVHALHGLGGIGKSTLAAQWAANRVGDHNPVWWITAESQADVDAGLAAFAAAFQPVLTDVLPQEALRERALQWLTANDGWLLILDNVSEPVDIKPLLARATTGRLLITSRRATGWHGIARPLALDVLKHAEAVALFTRILCHDRPRDTDGVDALCAELGHLPLAVEQAAAYCAETGTSPRAYLGLLAQHPADLYAVTAEGGDNRRTIARTWRVTLDRLADDPLTGRILRVVAWLAPNGIPRGLLAGLGPAPAVRRALGRLAAHSMITLDGDALTLHRLVQAVARTPAPDDPYRHADDIAEARAVAAAALCAALPDDPEEPASWSTWRLLLPHADALAEHAPADTDIAETARVLNDMGWFQLDQGAVKRAIEWLRRAQAACVRVLGEDHPDTLMTQGHLAEAYRTAGDAGRAIKQGERALAGCIRALGEDHLQTLTLRGYLADAYRAAGDAGRAVALFERVLADCLRLLGEDHQGTLDARLGLAFACRAAGDARRAVPLGEQVLADCIRVLGEDHADALIARSYLADAYRAAGEVKRAIPLYDEAYADCVRVLGEHHPVTRIVRGNREAARRRRPSV